MTQELLNLLCAFHVVQHRLIDVHPDEREPILESLGGAIQRCSEYKRNAHGSWCTFREMRCTFRGTRLEP